MKTVRISALLAFALVMATSLPAQAVPSLDIVVDGATTAGVSFSYTQSGDVITITETWTSPGVLYLSMSAPQGYNPTTNYDRYQIVKTITNNTGVAWTSFEDELMVPGSGGGWDHSPDNDGLSFAQGSGLPRTSTAFSSLLVDELDYRDFLNFYDGTVSGSGGTDTQSFYIDLPFGYLEVQPYALRQEPNVPPVPPVVPEPATVLLVGGGLLGLAALRRKKG